MCKSKSSCLCHFIKNTIQNDKTKYFKTTFFTPRYQEELYEFLSFAYQIVDGVITKKKINTLINGYLNNDSPRSVNVHTEDIKTKFFDQAELYLEGDAAEAALKESLKNLIQDIEKLAYYNLQNENFNAYIKNQQNTEKPNHGRAKSKCTLL